MLAELSRLRSDRVLPGFLAFAPALACLLLFAAPGRPSAASLPSALTQVALVATGYGVIRYGLDRRSGLAVRRVLTCRRTPALRVASSATALAGALIGLTGGVGALLALHRVPAVQVDVVVSGVLVCALGAVCGLFVGVVVDNYFLAPTVVVLVHIGSALIAETWPRLADLLPLLRVDGTGVLVQLAWALVLGVLAWVVASRRDIA